MILEKKLNTLGRFQDFVSSRPTAVSLLYTIIPFAAIVTILRPGYGTNDDIRHIATVAGYMGGRLFPFLIWSNVLLGLVLNFLYGLNSTINWEIWIFAALHFFSVWALVYLVFSQSVKTSVKLFGALVILLSDVYFLLNLTFTTVAATASTAGFCLVLTAAQSPRMVKQSRFLFGVVLIVAGSLVRLESTGLALVILIPGLVIGYQFFPIKNLILAFTISGALVLGCYVFNLAYLHRFPEWNSFNVYAATRRMLNDTPRLVNAAGSLRDVHWTTNDLNMFARHFSADANTYSLQNLRYLVEHVSDKRPAFWNSLLLFPRHLLDEIILPYTLLVLLVWTGMLFNGFASKQIVISTSLTFLAPFAINIYLLWTQKVPDYVLLASLASSAIYMLFIGYWSGLAALHPIPLSDTRNRTFQESDFLRLFRARQRNTLSKAGPYAIVLFFLVVIGVVVRQSIETTRTNIIREAVYHRILSDIRLLHLEEGGQKAIIISPAFGIPWEWSNPLFLDFPDIQYLVLGWETFSPAYDNVLRKYQVGSLPAGLYEAKNVYLMTDETTMNGIIKFIMQHEGVVVKPRLVYSPNYDTGTIYDAARLYKLEKQP